MTKVPKLVIDIHQKTPFLNQTFVSNGRLIFMSRISEHDTKTLILDAAERAFAENGFAAASLRNIIADAGVNIAAVHYYFGSKDGLIAAVFARRIQPLNQERLSLLNQFEREAGKRPVPVTKLIEALIGPALRLARDSKKGGPIVRRLFGRTMAEPSESLQDIFKEQFSEICNRFTAAFQKTVPGLPQDVLLWRIQFMIGAMAHIACDPQNLKNFSHGLCDANDTETAIQQMVACFAAGLRAPAPAAVKGKKK